MTPSPLLDTTLRRHIAAVDRRVTAGGDRYPEERLHVRTAAQRVCELQKELQLGRLVGSLTPPTAKPQFILLFEDDRRRRTVLKAYGRSRGGEGAALQLWSRNGVSAATVLEHSDTPTTWLLMRPIEGRPMPRVAGTALHRYTRELATTMSAAHHACGHHRAATSVTAGLPGERFRDLAPEITRHLSVAVDLLAERGYPAPEGWRRLALETYSAGPVTLLHGDLAPANLMLGPSDEITVIDPSAYIGNAAFDAARWSARTGGPEHARPLLDEWRTIQGDLDQALALRMLGLELLMEAGVREIVKAERGEPTRSQLDPATTAYLDACRELLASAT